MDVETTNSVDDEVNERCATIHDACINGDVRAVRNFINAGRYTVDENGNFPFVFCAAKSGHAGVVQLLLNFEWCDIITLDHHTSFELSNGEEHTLLSLSAQRGWENVVCSLLDRNGYCHCELDLAMMLAIEHGHHGVVIQLLNHTNVDRLTMADKVKYLDCARKYGQRGVSYTLKQTPVDTGSKRSTQ